MSNESYCNQGHPGHDPRFGCGPCADERAAAQASVAALPPSIPAKQTRSLQVVLDRYSMVEMNGCESHPAFEADNCPGCGTSVKIGGNR